MKQAEYQRASQIWQAGVAAVDPEKLIQERLRLEGSAFVITVPNSNYFAQELRFDGRKLERILVVGAGKAGATMAAAVERLFLSDIPTSDFWQTRFAGGWVNVPADCVRPLRRIQLCAARPAGVNEPRPEGVVGTREILRRVSELTPQDLCICLISGGGSALLPAPIEGISLGEKIAVTRFLSGAGANITQLNKVRKQLSVVKGGGLARVCRAPLVSLILSDVLGDPLDVIASGPTVLSDGSPISNATDSSGLAQEALEILGTFHADAPHSGVSANLWRVLETKAIAEKQSPYPPAFSANQIWNLVLGNNRTAVEAAADEARKLGYEVVSAESAEKCEGNVHQVAISLVDRMLAQIQQRMSTDTTQPPLAMISGGEPVVQLAEASIRGKGGRNTQLVLEALIRLYSYRFPDSQPRSFPHENLADGVSDVPLAQRYAEEFRNWVEQMVILSGGTDGEDGPTDAAGAVGSLATFTEADSRVIHTFNAKSTGNTNTTTNRTNTTEADDAIVQLAADAIDRNDSWTFFHRVGGLLRTGPTGTNVCDLRVVLFESRREA